MEKFEFDPSELDAKIAEAYEDSREQSRLFKKKRANQLLTEGEVRAIKMGRKKLRMELKARGITKKKDFELIASSMGLYFDRRRGLLWFLWFFHGKGLATLLGALAALLGVLFLFSLVTQMQGHFTINMSEDMFSEGFSLSEEVTFADPKMRLFCDPAVDVPCFSIMDIHSNVDDVDGQHNEAQYFAYTFYIRNEGQNTVGYEWELEFNSESHSLSDATWIMLFEDGEMTFYAKGREDGTQEALPYFDDNSRGYLKVPFLEDLRYPFAQYEVVAQNKSVSYYRLIPEAFESDWTVDSGTKEEVAPGQAHKYTVVIWLEGDDPDCTDELIGGHMGLDMRFRMINEEDDKDSTDNWFTTNWDMFWDNLIYWGEDGETPNEPTP